MSRKWLIAGSLVMAVPALALLLPYAVGVYHLQAGGEALDAALGEIDALNWWYVGPIAGQERPELEKAVLHLEKAALYTHALRLLGRAHAARGDFLSSVEALRAFTAQRPENPLGRLELAAAYGRANQQLEGMYSASLLEALPGSAVSAPDLPGGTRFQPDGWRSAYAYPTAFILSPDEEERPTLFLHAGSQVTFTVALTQPAVLSFGVGLDPRSLDWGGDGVTFEVSVDGARIFMEHLPVEVAREGWQERQVDLAAYAGQTVALSLASTPGPAGDATADWAGWGDPRVEDAEAAAYRRVVRGEPWLDEWALAGVTAQDFINAGEVARRAERYAEALGWYEWATKIDPELGDPWYYVGLIYEAQERWEDALVAYQGAIAARSLRQVHTSSLYYRLGMLYQWRLVEEQLERALEAYETALEADDFGTRWEAADCHHQYGAILRRQGASPDEYSAAFRRAIELSPTHAWAHALLGLTIYERDRDLPSSELELLKAIELDPRNKWFLFHLGDIYLEAEDAARAGRMYELALEIDPGFQQAQDRLNRLGHKEKE